MKIYQTNNNQIYSQNRYKMANKADNQRQDSIGFTSKETMLDRRMSSFNSSLREQGIMKILAPLSRIFGAALFGGSLAYGFKGQTPSFDLDTLACMASGLTIMIASSLNALGSIRRAAFSSLRLGRTLAREDIEA